MQQHQGNGSEKVRHLFLSLLMFRMWKQPQALGNSDYHFCIAYPTSVTALQQSCACWDKYSVEPLLKSYSVLILTQAEIKGNSVLRDTRANAPISHGITPQYHSYQCRLWTSLTVGWFLLSCFNLVSDEVKNLQSLSTPFAYAWHIPSLVYCYRTFDETCRDSQEIAFQARFGS